MIGIEKALLAEEVIPIAFTGSPDQAEWSDKGPQRKLRSLFSIYSESVTLIASVKSGINYLMKLSK